MKYLGYRLPVFLWVLALAAVTMMAPTASSAAGDKGIDTDLKTTKGWELGIGPSIVIVDEGAGKNFSTTTLKSEIYAFFFGQKGLMGGMGIQGTKISKMK